MDGLFYVISLSINYLTIQDYVLNSYSITVIPSNEFDFPFILIAFARFQ